MTALTRVTGLVLAAGALPHQVYAFRVDGEPIAKARVRVNEYRHYADGRTTDAELDIARAIQANGGAPGMFPNNIAVAAIFFRSNRHRVDVDNLLKTALDGITKSGLVWADDDQVTALLGVVEHDSAWPRIEIAVGHHESTMLRGDARLTHTCETCGARYRPHSERQGPSRYCSRACRPGRPPCIDCGGATSHSSAARCRACHDVHRGVIPLDSVAAALASPEPAAATVQEALL